MLALHYILVFRMLLIKLKVVTFFIKKIINIVAINK